MSMTESEEKLLELVLSRAHLDSHGDIADAIRAVLMERLTPEFRQNYRELAFRAWDAQFNFDKYANRAVTSALLYRETREAWKKERGIE